MHRDQRMPLRRGPLPPAAEQLAGAPSKADRRCVIITTTAPQRRPKPSAAELAHEIGAVCADLPRFVTAPLYRRWHQHWGATAAEVAAAMPGDELVADAQVCCTRAITIDAPPEAVWPWLVQVGCLRAGFYADDLLDNLGRPSAREILPEFQHLEVGQWVPMSPKPSELTAHRVVGFEAPQWLLWRQPTSTWVWTLTPAGDGATRLVTRLRIFYDWAHPAPTLLALVLTEFGDFAMMRRMLLGVKARAERHAAASVARRPRPLPSLSWADTVR